MRQAWPTHEPDDRGLVAAVILAIVFIAGVVVGAETRQPYCPEEDSCVVDYRDGAWHIEEVVP